MENRHPAITDRATTAQGPGRWGRNAVDTVAVQLRSTGDNPEKRTNVKRGPRIVLLGSKAEIVTRLNPNLGPHRLVGRQWCTFDREGAGAKLSIPVKGTRPMI